MILWKGKPMPKTLEEKKQWLIENGWCHTGYNPCMKCSRCGKH
nr:MAG TPA_asm: hypothetical protein [Caudoviricetes sp.]